MLTRRIIPCFDVAEGRVVKGISFVELRDAGDPVELAAQYDRQGADELVFLDITASSDARTSVYDMIRSTADQVFIPFTIGGGIRTVDDARRLLRAGADKVSINTAAVQNRTDQRGRGALWQPVHRGRHRREGIPDGGPTTVGGLHPRGAPPPVQDVVAWARVVERGAGELLLTSMDTDGHQDGYDVGPCSARSPTPSRSQSSPPGARAARSTWSTRSPRVMRTPCSPRAIFHFGTYRISEVKAAIAAAGLPIRPVSESQPLP